VPISEVLKKRFFPKGKNLYTYYVRKNGFSRKENDTSSKDILYKGNAPLQRRGAIEFISYKFHTAPGDEHPRPRGPGRQPRGRLFLNIL
jgi:hypothetical protein